MADQWFLNEFECKCGLKYWFEVTEMEVATRAAPTFPEVRDYVYYCEGCKTNKIVFYTAGDITQVKEPVPRKAVPEGVQDDQIT